MPPFALRFPAPALRAFALFASLCAFSATPALADVIPAPLFQDHAVLQQGRPVPVWGRARAGEKITVTYSDGSVSRSASAIASADGRWRTELPALPASASPATLTFAGQNTVTRSDILVGEVWLCSGQSNMAWLLKWSRDGKAAIAAADRPLIRHFKIKQASSRQPSDQLDGAAWEPASPATAGDFTAVGYLFARELQPALGVPVGLINASYGGTPVESWMSDAHLRSEPALQSVLDRVDRVTAAWPGTLDRYRADTEAWKQAEAAAKAAGQSFTTPKPRQPVGPGHPYMPSQAYNAMLHPLVGYGLRGALWYQGEANAGRNDTAAPPSDYAVLFRSLIRRWRADWAQGDFPFLFVQLANYKAGDPAGTSWAELREAQAAALAEPATGMAVAIDVGDPDDIHPRDKLTVARRLAALALKQVYGRADTVASGPTLKRHTFPGATARLEFDPAHGLALTSTSDTGFELAGSDRVFHPAEARVEAGGIVRVTSAAVPAPVAVRYAWRNAPAASLKNAAGLPAAPFRTDTW